MLVKDGDKRFARWKTRYDIVKNGKPIRQLSEESEQKLKKEFIRMAEIENEAKIIISKTNTPTMLNFAYLAFAREIYGLVKRYTKKTLQNQVEITLLKWQAQQLNQELLVKIKDKVFEMMGIDLIV
ncbi:MAG: hypothetical protein KGZ86_00800 [Candidatus Latescibacteria bacterium]|nr:hypothetical protein [Candidatus Latescibacterota bacterium]